MGEFLGMGWSEILMVAIVGLLVLGPERLPKYARTVGKYIKQFRKITSGITQEINRSLELDDLDGVGGGVEKDLKEISRSLEEDAARLKKSFSAEAASLEKAVNKGVEEVGETLVKESAEITASLNDQGKKPGKDSGGADSAPAPENTGGGNTSPEAMVEYQPPPPGEWSG